MTPAPTWQRSSLWPYVALTAILCGFFLGIFIVIPDDQPQMRTALLGVLIVAGQAAVTRFLQGRVKEVKQQVNGRMTQLLEALQVSTDDLKEANQKIRLMADEAHVSRETTPPAKKARKAAPRGTTRH